MIGEYCSRLCAIENVGARRGRPLRGLRDKAGSGEEAIGGAFDARDVYAAALAQIRMRRENNLGTHIARRVGIGDVLGRRAETALRRPEAGKPREKNASKARHARTPGIRRPAPGEICRLHRRALIRE